jgi:hypothetical protein
VVITTWARRSVTHVISEQLCGSKIEKELNSAGRANAWRGAIVRPIWLLDTVEKQAKQAVSSDKYALIVQPGARGIAALLAPL